MGCALFSISSLASEMGRGNNSPPCRGRDRKRLVEGNPEMSAPLKTVESTSDISSLLHEIGQRAKDAARALALAPTARKDAALSAMAAAIRARRSEIIAANQQDLADA